MILNLTKHRKAQIWTSSLPLRLLPIKVLTLAVSVDNEASTGLKRTAVEYYVPAGPKINYALLGAEFTPSIGGQLTIEIYLSDTVEAPTDWATMNQSDIIVTGLLPEYANGIFDGALVASTMFKLGAGLLRFDCGAYGKSSSSSMFFKRLAIIVVGCLQLDLDQTQERQLIDLLEDTSFCL